MKKLILIIILISLATPVAQAKEGDIINFQDDKVPHFLGGVSMKILNYKF